MQFHSFINSVTLIMTMMTAGSGTVTDRQTDRQTDTETDRQRERESDRETWYIRDMYR